MATRSTCLGDHKRGEPHFPTIKPKKKISKRNRERISDACGHIEGHVNFLRGYLTGDDVDGVIDQAGEIESWAQSIIQDARKRKAGAK